MKRYIIFISIMVSAIIACGKLEDQLITVDYYGTNEYFPVFITTNGTNYAFPGINSGVGNYVVVMNSGFEIYMPNLTNHINIMTNFPIEVVLVKNSNYTSNTFREIYIITDGKVLSGPSVYIWNTALTNFTTGINTYGLRNGTHYFQPWLHVFSGGTNKYIPGTEVEVFVTNQYLSVASESDPANDYHGYLGDFSLPLSDGADGTYLEGLQDITNVEVFSAGGNMKITLKMVDTSIAWSPDNGFDHVAFLIYLDNPSKTGVTFLPKQNANVPMGMDDWDYLVFGYGWGKNVYSTTAASTTFFGSSVGVPDFNVDLINDQIEIMVFADSIGNPTSLSNWTMYITTFDFDGMTSDFRRIGLTNNTPDHQFHSDRADLFNEDGEYTNAIVLDWVGPFTLN